MRVAFFPLAQALARRLNLEELQAQLFPADDDGTFWEDEEGNRQDAGPSNPGAGAGGDATQGLTAGAHGASEAPNARGFGLLPEGARIMQPQAQTFAHAGPAAHVVAAPPGGGGGGAGGVEDDEEPVAEITLDDDAENQQDGLPTAERIQSGGA